MQNTRRWEFRSRRMAVQCRHIWKTHARGCYSDGTVCTGQRTWKNAGPPLFMIMDKGWDCPAETPTWASEFPSEKLTFQSLLEVTTRPSVWPARGAWGWWKRAVSLCHEACTPLSRCAYNLWNSCFVEIMKFFGPWFHERQYFHNPVNMGISKWLQAGTNGTGTN